MYSETLLEVLGADLGVQDLLRHGTGKPASLLVMQALAKDPPCKGGSRVRARQGWAFLSLVSPLSGKQGLSHTQEFSISHRAVAGHPT